MTPLFSFGSQVSHRSQEENVGIVVNIRFDLQMQSHIYLVSYSPELYAWQWEVELKEIKDKPKAGYKK